MSCLDIGVIKNRRESVGRVFTLAEFCFWICSHEACFTSLQCLSDYSKSDSSRN